MEDRELLELAAKAAGINLRWMGGPVEVCDGIITAWNPLFDDGDALRLAVHLDLLIMPDHDLELVLVDSFSPLEAEIEHWEDGGKLAATRRAIVRAAAEIGKQMN